jgi:hypothetical protein
MASLAFQVDDRPGFLTLLDVTELQIHSFMPPDSTCEENREEARSRFPLSCSLSGVCHSRWDCSGVSQLPRAGSEFLDALHTRAKVRWPRFLSVSGSSKLIKIG